jgi:hypothetical protein
MLNVFLLPHLFPVTSVIVYVARQEEEFSVYEPYCTNYTSAVNVMVENEQTLMVSLFQLLFRPIERPASSYTVSLKHDAVAMKTTTFDFEPALTGHLVIDAR